MDKILTEDQNVYFYFLFLQHNGNLIIKQYLSFNN